MSSGATSPTLRPFEYATLAMMLPARRQCCLTHTVIVVAWRPCAILALPSR